MGVAARNWGLGHCFFRGQRAVARPIKAPTNKARCQSISPVALTNFEYKTIPKAVPKAVEIPCGMRFSFAFMF